MQQGAYGSGRGGQSFPPSNTVPFGNTSVSTAFVGPGGFPFSGDGALFGAAGAFGGGTLPNPGFMGISQVGADPMGNVAGAGGFPSAAGGQTGVMSHLGMVGQTGLPYGGGSMGQLPDNSRGGGGGGGGGGPGGGPGGSRNMGGAPGGGAPGGCGGFGRGGGGPGRGGNRGSGGKGGPGGGRGGDGPRGPGGCGGKGGGFMGGGGGGKGGKGGGGRGGGKGGGGGRGGDRGGTGGGRGGGGSGGGGGGGGGNPQQPLMNPLALSGAAPIGLGAINLGGKTGMPGPPAMNPPTGGQKGGKKGKDFGPPFKGGPPFGKGKGFGFPMFWGGKGKSKGQMMLRVDPTTKVWVGNLSENTKWKELQEHLDKAAKTKWVEVFSGKGALTGAAVFAEAADVKTAVEMLNGSVLDGNTIIVDFWQTPAKTSEEDGAQQEPPQSQEPEEEALPPVAAAPPAGDEA